MNYGCGWMHGGVFQGILHVKASLGDLKKTSQRRVTSD